MTREERHDPGNGVDAAAMSAMPPHDAETSINPTPPGMVRRLACFLYEGVLLFGVVMAAGLVYGSVMQQRHALQGKLGLQVFLFAVLGLYFSWFWSHGGQTLAMKTWHLRLVTVDGSPVSPMRAWARYMASWLWFLPALLAARAGGLTGTSAIAATLMVGVLAYVGLARLRRDRQFLHDIACATRVVSWRPKIGTKAEGVA